MLDIPINIKIGEFALTAIAGVLLSIFVLRGCDVALKKQAEVDYQQCLAWQADGYEIRCDEGKYK